MQYTEEYRDCKAKDKLDRAIGLYVDNNPGSRMTYCLNEFIHSAKEGRSPALSNEFLLYFAAILHAIPDQASRLRDLRDHYDEQFLSGMMRLKEIAPASKAASLADLDELMESMSLESQDEDVAEMVRQVAWSHECQALVESVLKLF